MKRFLYDYSTQTHHLLELLQEDRYYIWTETHHQAFTNLKQSLSSESCVSYFDNHGETFIYTDPFAEIEKPSKLQNHCV